MKDYSNYYPTYEDTILNSGKLMFEQQLKGTEGKEVLIDGSITTRALVKYHQNPLNEFRESRKITLWHDEVVHRGSIIQTIKDERTFLILSEINENDMVKYALMRETNKTIKWINKTNILIEKPAITTSQTLYTTGIKEEKLIQVPDGMTGILFPYDNDTKELNRGCSFVFNKAKYTITHYNEADRPGLLTLICEEAIPHEVYDDLENEISDRWDKDGKDRLEDNVDEPDDELVSITISGADSIMITDKATYTATVYVDGIDTQDEPVAFTLSNNLANFESQGNNQCVVRANANFNTGRVTLTATLTNDETVFIEKEIRIVGL